MLAPQAIAPAHAPPEAAPAPRSPATESAEPEIELAAVGSAPPAPEIEMAAVSPRALSTASQAPPDPPPAPEPSTASPRNASKESPQNGAAAPYRVQLLSGRSAAAAEEAWKKLVVKHADVLGWLKATVMRADLGDRGIYFRLRAGPLASKEEARAICAALVARDQGCFVVRQ